MAKADDLPDVWYEHDVEEIRPAWGLTTAGQIQHLLGHRGAMGWKCAGAFKEDEGDCTIIILVREVRNAETAQ